MDASRLLLIFVVISTSECSGPAEPQCLNHTEQLFRLLEGESFYVVPYDLVDNEQLEDKEITWSKNKLEISSAENRIHYHGKMLFFLNLRTEDSGFYSGRYVSSSGHCRNYYVRIEVFKASHRSDNKLLYGKVENSDENQRIRCPDPVMDTCDYLGGNFTWYKDFTLLQSEHKDHLWVKKATKDHEGIYTCNCTWEHNNKIYYSSGSRRLIVKDRGAYRGLEILSPSRKEQFEDEGSESKLNCSVFCGTNIQQDCSASWHVNGVPFNWTHGYNQTTKTVTEKPSLSTISTAILTIERVSDEDFHAEFKCIGTSLYTTVDAPLSLKRRESIIPLVIGGVSVLFFCVFAAVLVKCFAIDLALLFRPYLPLSSRNKDVREYDAYVIYQTQSLDKVTEDKLCWFITVILPSVLEEKCGYRLFIHGRDDIPGEDCLEQVEERMEQSRRLMIILTPGSGSDSEIIDQCPASAQNSITGSCDWQVGLHYALVQREMTVILIQLGDTGPQGYTNLPPGLQHLIRKSAPLRLPEGSRRAAAWNSRFWKRVRYLMPATPAKKWPKPAIISNPSGL